MALNAVRMWERRSNNKNGPFVNILLVHDLFAPSGQDIPFFEIISKMASAIMPWETKIYIDAGDMDRLQSMLIERGSLECRKEVARLIGNLQVDEVFISRDWQPGSQLLLTVFNDATSICYGDSIGLYFPETYFSDRDILTRLKLSTIGRRSKAILQSARYAIKYPSRKPLLSVYDIRPFTFGFFTFPEVAGTLPPFPYERIQVGELKNTFSQFLPVFSFDILEKIGWMRNPVSVLLTSNFSEAGRVQLNDELFLYETFLQRHLKSEGGILLIKPHPRDSTGKLALLKQRLTDKGYDVHLLDSPTYFFTPFEFFLLQLEKHAPEALSNLSIFATSSSCLSVRLMFSKRPHLGFGETLVKKYFVPSQIKARVDHEEDLQKAMR